MLKSNKGYSLIEIGVGIIILSIFLFFSIGLFNGCYTNYRRIKQRNIAMDRAIYFMENMIQTDSDVLTGFFIQELDPATRMYSLGVNPVFKRFVKDHMSDYKNEYVKYKNIKLDDYSLPTDDEIEDFILYAKDYLINQYIKYDANEKASVAQLQNGTYGFLTDAGRYNADKYEIVIENEQLEKLPQMANYDFATSNGGAFRVKKTISRIPSSDSKAYGNAVLRLQIDVYYSYDYSDNLEDESKMQVITLKTIKL